MKMKRKLFLAAALSSLTALGLRQVSANSQPFPQQPKKSSRYTCRILAIDGGGIRGIVPSYFLQQIEASLGKQIYECFDVIVGTSSGGMIAMALTTPKPSSNGTPYSASEILQFYLQEGDKLFVPQASDDLSKSKYYAINPEASPATGIEPWLQSKFTSSITLSQAQAQLKALGKPIPKQVLATSYTLDGNSEVRSGPYLFNWADAASNPADDYCIWEVARATSAAPIYFPIAHVGSGTPKGSQATTRWAVDGSVVVTNPSLYGLSWAARLGLFTDLSNVLLISLGAGSNNAEIKVSDGNWGIAQWIASTGKDTQLTTPLTDTFISSGILGPDQQSRSLLTPKSYYRLEPIISGINSAIDSTDTQDLLNITTQYLSSKGNGYAVYQNILNALT